MSWIIYSVIAIGIVGVSDVFRKLASNLKDPFFANLIFQTAAFATTIISFLIFSRKIENNQHGIIFAILGGITIATFSLFSFKALSLGPGVSVVMPILRIGGIAFLVFLGVTILREKLTIQTIFGLIFSTIGIYLLFSNQ